MSKSPRTNKIHHQSVTRVKTISLSVHNFSMPLLIALNDVSRLNSTNEVVTKNLFNIYLSEENYLFLSLLPQEFYINLIPSLILINIFTTKIEFM